MRLTHLHKGSAFVFFVEKEKNFALNMCIKIVSSKAVQHTGQRVVGNLVVFGGYRQTG